MIYKARPGDVHYIRIRMHICTYVHIIRERGLTVSKYVAVYSEVERGNVQLPKYVRTYVMQLTSLMSSFQPPAYCLT